MYAIGQAAERTGIKATTIRFYEEEGLLAPPARTASGRRLYSDAEVRRLTFIRHGRALGFELDDIRSLLDLVDHPDDACDDANQIARRHLADVEQRLAQLAALKIELSRLVRSCVGGKAAQCRVIEALADHAQCKSDHDSPQPKPRSRKKAQGRRRRRTARK